MTLSGLNVPPGKTVLFHRDARDDLVVTVDGVRMLSHRTAASDDDLILSPGTSTISFSADVACDVAAYVVGRWL